MRSIRSGVVLCCVLALLGGCGSGKHKKASTSATTVAPATTAAPVASTSIPSTTTVTDVLPTIKLPCQPIPIPATPVTSPAPANSVLLTAVDFRGDKCVDHVVWSFTSKGSGPPGYSITYGTPPFLQDGSGRPVSVQGTAFVVVTIPKAYGFDFENARTTYTGSKHITPPATANHVKEIVETGDFEGVLTWVIGLDTKRAFSVQATGSPQTQLVVTIS
jgi:hypothetical protein